MFKKPSPQFLGFLQVTGLVVYLILISLFFNLVTPLLNNQSESFYAPIIMLLLFTISAVISATLILGRFGMLFWDKKYKEAFTLLGYTVGWGFFYLTLFILFFINR